MALTGGCHCGTIRYQAKGEPAHVAVCHCSDCRKSSGAPMVGWALFADKDVMIEGVPSRFQSSEKAVRFFCPTCGSGLFYTNPSVFPDQIDIQVATLDDPTALSPQIHVQMAEALPWMAEAHMLPKFDTYPGE